MKLLLQNNHCKWIWFFRKTSCLFCTEIVSIGFCIESDFTAYFVASLKDVKESARLSPSRTGSESELSWEERGMELKALVFEQVGNSLWEIKVHVWQLLDFLRHANLLPCSNWAYVVYIDHRPSYFACVWSSRYHFPNQIRWWQHSNDNNNISQDVALDIFMVQCMIWTWSWKPSTLVNFNGIT